MANRSLLQAYYLATPLFAGLDLGMGLSVRSAGIDGVAPRLAYYAGAFLLGLVMAARPRAAPWLGMGESVLNLTLLMAAVLVPVWSLAETMDATVVADLPSRVANLALSGAVLVYSFHRHQARALGASRPGSLSRSSSAVRPP